MSADALSTLAARLRALPALGAAIAAEAAPVLLALNKASATAGTTPDGRPWAPTKRGERALVHASDALSTRVVGDIVYLVVSGVYAFHNQTRRILPYRGIELPASYRDAIRTIAQRMIGGAL